MVYLDGWPQNALCVQHALAQAGCSAWAVHLYIATAKFARTKDEDWEPPAGKRKLERRKLGSGRYAYRKPRKEGSRVVEEPLVSYPWSPETASPKEQAIKAAIKKFGDRAWTRERVLKTKGLKTEIARRLLDEHPHVQVVILSDQKHRDDGLTRSDDKSPLLHIDASKRNWQELAHTKTLVSLE